MVQDRRVGPGGAFAYTPDVDDFATGFLGDVPFGNGVQRPRVRVTADQYRLRVLNGSAARVYRLALSTGAPLVAVGNDGGLLPAAVSVDDIYLGVAERIDVLVDLTTHAVGDRVTLRSLAFSGFGGNAGTAPQGTELDLLELEVVSGGGRQATVLPPALSTVPLLTAGEATNVRTFELASAVSGESHAHTINERSFDMYRVDEQISLGAIERWVFRNLSALPHPVHLHGTHFQVLSRTGGRSTVYPYEGGWKDTVLVMPSETVDVLVRFDAYRGIFPLHCHNLQHEDMGMMLNIEVV